MKKIFFLLALSLAMGTLLSAADVSVGGWFETHGRIRTLSGDAVTKAEEDARIIHGTNEFGIDINISGENFGGKVHLGGWAAEATGICSNSGINSGHIWAEMLPNLKIYAGVGFDGVITYAPSAASVYENNGLGLGLGKYNYEVNDNKYTYGGVSGLIAEYKLDTFSAALVVKNDFFDFDTKNDSHENLEPLEEAMKNMFNINVKYSLDTATLYGGFAQKTVIADGSDDESQPAIWLAISTNLMEGLLFDVKYEGIFASEAVNSPTLISTNLGYNLGSVNIKTTEEIVLTDGEMGWAVAGTITPTLPIAAGLDINALVSQAAGDDTDMLYKFGATVSKEFGNVSSSLGVDYELIEKDKSIVTLDAKMSMWF